MAVCLIYIEVFSFLGEYSVFTVNFFFRIKLSFSVPKL